ncbi:MAG: MBL fold metallo-hydrolase [Clostridia bacterium]|nr:MBL fold metallo-hydrolase [Clostridia bacterium]
MKLIIQVCEVGFLPTNCWLVRDTASGRSFAVDPGWYDETLEAALRRMGVEQLDYILLTHGHHDHTLGLAQLNARFGGKIVLHESEQAFLADDGLSLRHPAFAGLPRAEKADVLVRDGDTLPFAQGVIRVLHTPGHTRGSVCYLLDDVLFAGDTLFRESVGRTDLPTGNTAQLLSSVRRLAALKGDCRVLPGHGPETTLAHERKYNPYL